MQYSIQDAADMLMIPKRELIEIRDKLKDMGLLKDRERINDNNFPFFERIVEKKKLTGKTYGEAISIVLVDMIYEQ